MLSPRWNIHTLTPEQQMLCDALSHELRISPLSARLLVDRGIRTADEARAFVRPSLDNLNDPFLMQDMDKAVARLETALQQHEHIMVYGDYDVDGTTAVALMYSFLQTLTDNLDFYIPDRYREGYGISALGIDTAKHKGCTLMIALDCGIKAVEKTRYAAEQGIDMIICDHHTPGDTLPGAVAVLNMKRADCHYPYKELSGCGVGFKLAQAYALHARIPMERVFALLPFLAMSIASDIVPITGENRILAYYGLRQLNRHTPTGIRAIMEVAGITPDHTITISDLVFKIGPRINACGRINSGEEAVRLLITEDASFARQQAASVNHFNTERRGLDTQTTEEALAMLAADPDNDKRHTTVVYSPSWHKGVVGIAASRLTENYFRPTSVFTGAEGNIISGSARSVSDFDIYSAIDSCRDLLTNFGGHRFAAGLSLYHDNLPAFKERFEAYVAAHITPEQQQPVLEIEAEVALAELTPDFWNVLRHLEPFGPGNERPLFMTHRLCNAHGTKAVGKGGEHLHLDVTDGTFMPSGELAHRSGIAFGQGAKADHFKNGHTADICYHIEENTFNHHTSLQLMAVDIHLNEPEKVVPPVCSTMNTNNH